MGLLEDATELAPALTREEFSGPGVARKGHSEFNQRELLRRWADDLESPVGTTPEGSEPGDSIPAADDKVASRA
jgi:hypothetical protein